MGRLETTDTPLTLGCAQLQGRLMHGTMCSVVAKVHQLWGAAGFFGGLRR